MGYPRQGHWAEYPALRSKPPAFRHPQRKVSQRLESFQPLDWWQCLRLASQIEKLTHPELAVEWKIKELE